MVEIRCLHKISDLSIAVQGFGVRLDLWAFVILFYPEVMPPSTHMVGSDDLVHLNKNKYPNQRMFVFEVDESAWLVPYIENEDEIFLKSVIPCRKATKHYLR